MEAANRTVKKVMWYRNLISSRYAQGVFIALCLCTLPAGAAPEFDAAMRRILSPTTNVVQYDYIMTARVRLLLFWIGADDVGDGYVRKSISEADRSVRLTEVLFGSDPAKAPRRINYWGAATEAANGESSAFMGFMKSAKVGSASEAEADMRKQQGEAQHSFEANITLIERARAVSRVVRLFSNTDFNLHQLDAVRDLAVHRLNEDPSQRELTGVELKCESPRGFLQAIDELSQYSINGGVLPRSLCYVYNARNYTLTLQNGSKINSRTIRVQRKNGARLETSYRDLFQSQFSILNHRSGERTGFELLLGTQGSLRAVPVQITHQPNWWFQVVLNLDPKEVK
jgi:hypothetical protein